MDELIKELKKFSGFMIPDNVKTHVNQLIVYLQSDQCFFPIKNSSSILIIALNSILENKRTLKISNNLIGIICNCISVGLITSEAIPPILRKIEQYILYFDIDRIMKIIQFVTNISSNHFLEPQNLQSLLGICLILCSYNDNIVSTSALAASDQIIKSLISYLYNPSLNLSSQNQRDIELSASLTLDNKIKFKNPIDRLSYLIFKDLIELSSFKSSIWLHVKNLDTNSSFLLLENFLLIPGLNFLLEEIINNALNFKAPLSFLIKLYEELLDIDSKPFITIFKFFLTNLNPIYNDSLRSLNFFRILFGRNINIIIKFFYNCDRDGTLFTNLINNLLLFSDSFIGEKQFDLSISIKNELNLNQNSIISSPVEIIILILQASYQAKSNIFRNLINKIWSSSLTILTLSSKYVLPKSLYIIMQGFHLLLILSYELRLEECKASVIASFSNLLKSEYQDLSLSSFDTISSIINSTPISLNNNWIKFLKILIELKWNPINADFSKNISNEELMDIVLLLLSIDLKDSKFLSLTLLVKILISNKFRFNFLWPAVEGYLLLLIDDFESEEVAFESFLKLLHENFVLETEKYLLETIEKIFSGRKRLSFEKRKKILVEINDVIKINGYIIKLGWSHFINALSPKNFFDEIELLTLSFRCVQIIFTDILYLTDEKTQLICLNLVFEFSLQNIDINIALSSFELLWSIISLVKTSEIWENIFKNITFLIKDKRNDIALAAVRTFFSLIISNSNHFNQDLYEFICNCFITIIDSLKGSDGQTQQLAIYELAHCGRKLFNEFNNINLFKLNFWKKLIDESERFFKSCNKKETATAQLQFFEEAFQCFDLSIELKINLFDSFERIIDITLSKENANSGIWSAIGRLILIILPPQKTFLNEYWLKRWIKIINSLFFDLDCGEFLPPTAHKTLDALDLLFPLSKELTEIVYTSFVYFSINSNNKRLTEVSIDHILKILEKKVEKEYLSSLFLLSKKLFTIKEAQKILLIFIQNDIEILDIDINNIYNSLIELSDSNLELFEEIGLCINKLFPRLNKDQQRLFLNKFSISFTLISLFWEKYLDPFSLNFNENISNNFNLIILNFITNLLINSKNENDIKKILLFLNNINSYSKSINSLIINKNKYHLFHFIPNISDLVLHPSIDIRQIIRSILLEINK